MTTEDIRKALFSISPTRAPGPDGFTVLFYQEYWEVVGPSLVQGVKDFFETGVSHQNGIKKSMFNSEDCAASDNEGFLSNKSL